MNSHNKMSVGGSYVPGQLIKSLDDLIAEEKKTHKKGSFMNKPIKKDKRFLREEMEDVEELPIYQPKFQRAGFQNKPFPKKPFIKPIQNF